MLSGGNIDPLLLLHVIQHGLAAAGRYLELHVRIADRPGRARGAARRWSPSTGGNVVDVAHSRMSGALGLGEVDVALTQWRPAAREHCVRACVGRRSRAAGSRRELVRAPESGLSRGTAPRPRG